MNAPKAPTSPEQLRVPVVMLTDLFQISGTLSVVGVLQTFINDEQRPTLVLTDSEVIGADVGNPAAHMRQPEFIVGKRQCHLLAIPNPLPQGALVLPQRGEPLMLYTTRYAIAGKYHMGPDARLNDFAEVSLSSFIGITEVRIFPMFPARPGIVESVPLALIHKQQVTGYHKL